MSFLKKIFNKKENLVEENIKLLNVLDESEIIEEPEERGIEDFEPIETEEFEEALDSEVNDLNEPSKEEPKDNELAPSLFKKIFSGLDKTRKNILGNVENVLKSFTKIDDDMFEELEEVLIMADIGVETSTDIIESVKQRVKKDKLIEVDLVKQLIIEEISRMLKSNNDDFCIKSPAVILVIGVNGVGKTTSIGKLAHNLKSDGKKIILAAADTFRAAAIDQLEIWASRNQVDIIKHQENSDPAAVVFDAIKAAKARSADVLICDTAGRLHNKKNLMDELSKIYKVINREYSEAHLEVFLVLDATTGQNALQQAKLFKEVASLTGLILTKLDGTAKGGVIIAIKNELDIPVRYIGIGEKIDDLEVFDAEAFAKALFGYNNLRE